MLDGALNGQVPRGEVYGPNVYTPAYRNLSNPELQKSFSGCIQELPEEQPASEWESVPNSPNECL